MNNAYVPITSPVLPPQALVAVSIELFSGSMLGGNVYSFGGFGITKFDSAKIFANIGGALTVDLSNNALDEASVNGFLAAMVDCGATNAYFDLSGGTSVTPTGQGITDKTTLIGAGCTVNTN